MKAKILLSRFMQTLLTVAIFSLLVATANGQSKARPETAYPFSELTLQNITGIQFSSGGNGITPDMSATTIGNGGDRLVATQNPDGGWGWPVSGSSATNTVGPIAKGLAQAYLYTLSATQLTALNNSKAFLLAKTNTFSPSDGYLAKALDDIYGGTTCRDHLNTYFYGPLAAGTYYRPADPTPYSTSSYITRIRTVRSGSQANMAAWDLGLGLVGAASCGVSGSELNLWIAGVEAEINELDGGNYYDVLGLAGALYGLAYVDAVFDPTSGEHAAAASISDLANILTSYQINLGGFAWNSDWVIPNDYNETIQETSYAILALLEVNKPAYFLNIIGAADYVSSVQLGNGGWENYFGAGENNEISAEALWGYTCAYKPSGATVENYTIGSWHLTIQDAIDCASNGDLIKVYPGTYNQDEANGYNAVTGGTGSSNFNIFVNKSVTIQGVDASGNPITDPDEVEAYVIPKRDTPLGNLSTFFVQADNVVIQGLDITAFDDPDDNFKTVSIIGNNVTVNFCKLHALDQVSCLYLYDPRFSGGISYVQSYTFEHNYCDIGGIYASGIRISSGPGWTGPVSGRLINGNTFVDGSYQIEFVGPGGDPWDVYPVGAAIISNNSFSGAAKGSVAAWGTYLGSEGYGSIDWDGIIYSNGNTFSKWVITKTPSGDVRSYNSGNFYYIRGIYNAIQRYPLNYVAQAGDFVYVSPGTFNESLTINKSNLTLEGSGSSSTFITTTGTTPGITVTANGVTVAELELTNTTQMVEGIRVNGATSGLTVENVDFTNLGNNPGPGNAYGIQISNSFTDLNVTGSNFIATNLGVYSRAMGIFAPAGSVLGNFSIDNCTFQYYFTGVDIRSEINGLAITNSIFGPQELQDCQAAAAGIYMGDGPNGLFDIDNVAVTGNLFNSFSRGVYIWNYAVGESIKKVNISENEFSNSIYSSPIRLNGRNSATPEATIQGPVNIENNLFRQSTQIVNGAGVSMIDLRAGIESLTSNLFIRNNEIDFTGPFTTSTWGIMFRGPLTNVEISGNNFNGNGAGGSSTNMPATSGIVFETNYTGYGEMSPSANFSIFDNSIEGFVNGITAYNFVTNRYGSIPSGAVVDVFENGISGNSGYGILSGTGADIDAADNWWGHATGPYHALNNVCGQGNTVSDNVIFSPWYSKDDMSSPRLLNTYNINGTIKYANNAGTLLNGILLTLKNSGGGTVATYNTNLTPGSYQFANIPNGDYTIQISSTAPGGAWTTWGGVNNTDYLLVYKHVNTATKLPVAPPVIRIAADVKNPAVYPAAPDILINDANIIRTAYMTNNPSLFDIPKWVFSGTAASTGYIYIPSVTIYCGDQTSNILGLCAGDVNASYLPPSGPKAAQPGVDLVNRGNLPVSSDIVFPVMADMNMEVGAITLFLDYDASLLGINGITMAGQVDDLPFFTTEGNVLNIGWASLTPVRVAAGEPLFYIHATVKNPEAALIRFTLNGNPLSELADGEGTVIGNSRLAVPDAGGNVTSGVLSVYPNPAKDVLHIDYMIEKDGVFSIDMRSTQGSVVKNILPAERSAGTYQQTLDVKGLAPGVYFLKVMTGETSTVRKVIIN